MSERYYDHRLHRHRAQLPRLELSDQEFVKRIRSEGAVLTTLDELGLSATNLLRQGLMALAPILTSRALNRGRTTTRPTRAELLANPEIWRWGLQERLLDLVESYIGLPVMYCGADVRCDLANGELGGVRQWHRDAEDRRQLKLLVWLVDVDVDGGPFEYVSRCHTAEATRALRYVSGYVSDAEMRRAAPAAQWHPCTAPAWTALLTDTAGVFHRLKPPTTRDRYSVTFSWTSRHPIKWHPVDPPSAEQRARMTAGLTPRQIACLPPLTGPADWRV